MIAGEVDAVPAQRREPGQHSRINGTSSAPPFPDGTTEIAAVKQNDNGGGDKVSCGRAGLLGLLGLQTPATETTEPLKGNCSGAMPAAVRGSSYNPI